MPFENIMENAHNHHFLLFPQCFLCFPHKFFTHIYFAVCKCLNLETSTNLAFGKELIVKIYLQSNHTQGPQGLPWIPHQTVYRNQENSDRMQHTLPEI